MQEEGLLGGIRMQEEGLLAGMQTQAGIGTGGLLEGEGLRAAPEKEDEENPGEMTGCLCWRLPFL